MPHTGASFRCIIQKHQLFKYLSTGNGRPFFGAGSPYIRVVFIGKSIHPDEQCYRLYSSFCSYLCQPVLLCRFPDYFYRRISHSCYTYYIWVFSAFLSYSRWPCKKGIRGWKCMSEKTFSVLLRPDGKQGAPVNLFQSPRCGGKGRVCWNTSGKYRTAPAPDQRP